MKIGQIGSVLLVVALAFPLSAVAEGGPGTCPGRGGECGRRGGGAQARLFDPKAVTTVKGEIAEIQRLERRRHDGVVLTVNVGSEALLIHLGPDFYVDNQSLKLAKGDTIEVKGSRFESQGKTGMIAQEVRRGNEVLTLRDAEGVPLWRGQGHGRLRNGD